jgi:thioredoxin-related protein
MKKIAIIILLIVSINLSAQNDTQNWLTDYKEAIKVSETKNNPILVFVTNNTSGERYDLLQNDVFNSNEFKRYASSFVLLKLDISTDSYHKRLAAHYTKSNSVPALALVDKNGNTIDKALTEINSKNISEFMTFLKTKTKY